jgi:hypothetical protein
MKRFVSVLLLLSIVTAGLIAFPNSKVYACSCVSGDAKEKLERSKVVFIGKVKDKGGTKKFQHGRLREYTFEVDRAWKGVNDKQITIYSYDGSSASCGFEFIKNQTYLVYSYQGSDNLIETNLCSGNLLLSQADDELKQLGTGTIIEQNLDTVTIKERNSFNLILFSGATLFIVIVVLLIWRNKRRR